MPCAGEEVAAVLRHLHAGPPLLGRTRLLCIDGPAGSGKTTLAAAVAGQEPALVVHLDDLLAGWDAPLSSAVEALVRDVLRPLADGRPATLRRYDWVAGAHTERVVLGVPDLLVVEGVGSGSQACDRWRSTLAWVEAPPEVRRRRGIERDGEAFAPHWDAWALKEADHFARERTRERADVLLPYRQPA